MNDCTFPNRLRVLAILPQHHVPWPRRDASRRVKMRVIHRPVGEPDGEKNSLGDGAPDTPCARGVFEGEAAVRGDLELVPECSDEAAASGAIVLTLPG